MDCEHLDAYWCSCPACGCGNIYCPDCETTPGDEPQSGCADEACKCHV